MILISGTNEMYFGQLKKEFIQIIKVLDIVDCKIQLMPKYAVNCLSVLILYLEVVKVVNKRNKIQQCINYIFIRNKTHIFMH